MGKLRQFSDKVSDAADKYGLANPIEVVDEALGGQTREESKKRRDEAKEGLRKYQASKDREQTKKMREPQSFGEKYALSTLRSQNKLAKEYEDIEKPKSLAEVARKGSADKLRKIADRTFKSLPEEVKDYEAYKDAGFKKGGKVSSASKRADGCAVRGKTKA
jgi:general stress protein YciG